MYTFHRLVAASERAQGVHDSRQTYLAETPVDKTLAEMQALIEADDPSTKRPFMTEVCEALIRPLSEESLRGSSLERTTPRLVEPATEDDLHRLFRERNWTDFL